MRVSRLAKSWNTLVAIRSKILSKLSSLLAPPSSLLSPLFLSNWFGLFEKILPLVIENSLILDLLERSNFADSLYFEKKKKIGKIYKRKIYSTNEKSIFSLIS